MLTFHALNRMGERMTSQEKTEAEELLARFVSENPNGSHAVKVGTLTGMRGQAWGEASNGQVLWAVVRDGTVTTAFLRRDTQPCDARALQVERVWRWY